MKKLILNKIILCSLVITMFITNSICAFSFSDLPIIGGFFSGNNTISEKPYFAEGQIISLKEIQDYLLKLSAEGKGKNAKFSIMKDSFEKPSDTSDYVKLNEYLKNGYAWGGISVDKDGKVDVSRGTFINDTLENNKYKIEYYERSNIRDSKTKKTYQQDEYNIKRVYDNKNDPEKLKKLKNKKKEDLLTEEEFKLLDRYKFIHSIEIQKLGADGKYRYDREFENTDNDNSKKWLSYLEESYKNYDKTYEIRHANFYDPVNNDFLSGSIWLIVKVDKVKEEVRKKEVGNMIDEMLKEMEEKSVSLEEIRESISDIKRYKNIILSNIKEDTFEYKCIKYISEIDPMEIKSQEDYKQKLLDILKRIEKEGYEES